MFVSDKPKRGDTQLIPNKPFLRDEKLLKLYQNYTEGKKFTRLSLNEPVISFHPIVTKRLKPAQFVMVFMTNLRSDVIVDNVELINRKDKLSQGIAGRADAYYLYGWVAENTYRFVVMILNRVLHVVDFNTETHEAKEVTDSVDLTVVKLFPYGYDEFYSADISAVYYDIVSGYFFVFHRQTSIFGTPDYGPDENGKPRGEFSVNILGIRGFINQRTKEMELLSKAMRFYGGILTEGDLPILSNELASFLRSSIDSTRLLPDSRVITHILAGNVSDEIYEGGNPNKIASMYDSPADDLDEPPF